MPLLYDDQSAGGSMTMGKDKADLPAALVSERRRSLWWSLICVIGLLLVYAAVTLHVPSYHERSAGQDYVPIVSIGSSQKGRPTVFNYKAALKITPSPVSGVALTSDIDDTSSEAAYQRGCLAALTRQNNPEIMALSEAVREDMCTDPRRK